MRKMLIRVGLAVGLAAATMGAPATATAENPNTVELTDWFALFPDTGNGLSVFVNITARDFCDWVAGPPGPPPVIAPITAQVKETGQGALVGRFSADVYIEVWRFDENPSPLVGPCEDIAVQLADPDAEPFAWGTAAWQGNDNDVFGTGTRGNAFGDRGRADLVDPDGTEWDYSWLFHVNSQCAAPGGWPSCLVERARLSAG